LTALRSGEIPSERFCHAGALSENGRGNPGFFLTRSMLDSSVRGVPGPYCDRAGV
jgi:hypothetical protein